MKQLFIGQLLYLGLTISLLMLVLAIGIKVRFSTALGSVKRLAAYWTSLLAYCGIFLVMVSFFRWQELPGLGSNAAYIVVAGLFLTGVIWLVIYQIVTLPKLKQLEITQKIQSKYIPKGHK